MTAWRLLAGGAALLLANAAVPALAGDSGMATVREFGAACDGVTDDSVALAAAANALRDTGRTILLDDRCRLRLAGAAQVWLRGESLRGTATRDSDSTRMGYGTRGGVLLIDSTSVTPFLVSSDWAMDGLSFYWPQQAATVGSPVVYPPLIATHGSDLVMNWMMIGNQIENAYDILDLHAAAAGSGHFHFERNQSFSIHDSFQLSASEGEAFIQDNQFSPVADQVQSLGDAARPGLLNAAAQSGAVLYITGTGSAAAQSSRSVDGLRFTGNYVLALAYGIHVTHGGLLNLAEVSGNGFDQVGTPLAVDDGGAATAVRLRGGTMLCQRLHDNVTSTPCISVDGGAPGSRLSVEDVHMAVSGGRGIDFIDTGSGDATPPELIVTGGEIENVGQIGARASDGINFNASGGHLTVTGTPITNSNPANASHGAVGISVVAARSARLTGNRIDGWRAPLRIDASSAVITATGNTSLRTAGPMAVIGSAAGSVKQAGNAWDVPN